MTRNYNGRAARLYEARRMSNAAVQSPADSLTKQCRKILKPLVYRGTVPLHVLSQPARESARTACSGVSRSDKLLGWELSSRASQGHVKLVALLAFSVGA